MEVDHAFYQQVISSNIALINQLSGSENSSYTISRLLNSESDNIHGFLAQGTDHKNYLIKVTNSPPSVLSASIFRVMD